MTQAQIITTVIVGVLLLAIVVLRVRTILLKNKVIDFQLNYHKEMWASQIKSSRRFIIKQEIAKNPKLKLFNRLSIAGMSLITLLVLTLIFSWVADYLTQGMLSGIIIAISLLYLGVTISTYQLNKALYTILNEDMELRISLYNTPKEIVAKLLKTYIAVSITTGLLLVVALVAVVTKTIDTEDVNINVLTTQRLRRQMGIKQPPATSSSSASTPATTNYNLTSAQISRIVPTKNDRNQLKKLGTQDQVALLSLYYLTLTGGSMDGFYSDAGMTYTYHLISNYDPKTIVITGQNTNGETRYTYLVQLNDQQEATYYSFANEVGQLTALHELVPAYTLMAGAKIKLTQLVHVFYDTNDGPYIRTSYGITAGKDLPY